MNDKHTILFLAADPAGTDAGALGEEASAIQAELERSGHRDRFELVTRWAAEPLDLLRELGRLKPTIVHFSGRRDQTANARRDGVEKGVDHGDDLADVQDGLYFQGADGRAKRVSSEALQEAFAAAGSTVRVAVLSACYSAPQAEALSAVVDCVVGMSRAIRDGEARSFAIGFYSALGGGESVATAFQCGRAAISLDALLDIDRPRLHVRPGTDASQVIPAETGLGAASGAEGTPRRRPASPLATRQPVDVGILTIRRDEFEAVLDAFPEVAGQEVTGQHDGPHRLYTLRRADAGNGERYTVAILRQDEQGNGEAHDAARDLIADLSPQLVIVVGIAGGLPSSDLTLGDVVVAKRIHDFTVEARSAKDAPAYAASGGPITRTLASLLSNLAARTAMLGDWTAGLPVQPTVRWTKKGQIYGPAAWRKKLRSALEKHHGPRSEPRRPRYVDGVIASSDRLVTNPDVLFPWIQTARDILAVEMESGGVYRAARERCPMLVVRGLSGIVGLQRDDAWTGYACLSAAAFTRAFLRTRPVLPGASSGKTHAVGASPGNPPKATVPRAQSKTLDDSTASPPSVQPSSRGSPRYTGVRPAGSNHSVSGPEATPSSGARRKTDEAAPSEMRERLARIQREIAHALAPHPRALRRLAERIPCGAELDVVASKLVDLRGCEAAAHLLAVRDAEPATRDGHGARAALRSALWTALPYVSDWREEVAACCARGEQEKQIVELDYRSDTVAEAVMAGWTGRQCAFDYRSGAEPFGVGAVQLPSTEQTALFTSEQSLREGVVRQLTRQFKSGGFNLHEHRIRVDAELRKRKQDVEPMQYYFLFRHAAWSEDELEGRWRLARTALHGEGGLPGLVLVRMQGTLSAEEADLEGTVIRMLNSMPPSRS